MTSRKIVYREFVDMGRTRHVIRYKDTLEKGREDQNMLSIHDQFMEAHFSETGAKRLRDILLEFYPLEE